jgi:hypothetical protein
MTLAMRVSSGRRRRADSFGMQRRRFGEDELRYTRERIAEKYTACQVLYWYRSNELWKNRRNPHGSLPPGHGSPKLVFGLYVRETRLRSLFAGKLRVAQLEFIQFGEQGEMNPARHLFPSESHRHGILEHQMPPHLYGRGELQGF